MKIKSINIIKNSQLTVDIEVKNTHSYQLQNGIVTHNSSSCMLGTASGIHPHHSRRYIRRVQANVLEGPGKLYSEKNPTAIEMSKWSSNNTDICIAFACEIPRGAIIKSDLSAIDLLEKIKSTQINWVSNGKIISRCAKPWLSHNVSNTVVVQPDEWETVEKFIFDNQQYFSGVTLLSSTGDKDFVQAPFTEVLSPEELVETYDSAVFFASGLIDDAMKLFDGLWAACDCVIGVGEKLEVKKSTDYEEVTRFAKLEWVSRVKKFSKKYYAGDLKKVIYLLKDVYNWKLWLDIKKASKLVNYEDLVEETNTTVGTNEIACAGGACTI